MCGKDARNQCSQGCFETDTRSVFSHWFPKSNAPHPLPLNTLIPHLPPTPLIPFSPPSHSLPPRKTPTGFLEPTRSLARCQLSSPSSRTCCSCEWLSHLLFYPRSLVRWLSHALAQLSPPAGIFSCRIRRLLRSVRPLLQQSCPVDVLLHLLPHAVVTTSCSARLALQA